jgi:hypothetical protein
LMVVVLLLFSFGSRAAPIDLARLHVLSAFYTRTPVANSRNSSARRRLGGIRFLAPAPLGRPPARSLVGSTGRSFARSFVRLRWLTEARASGHSDKFTGWISGNGARRSQARLMLIFSPAGRPLSEPPLC